MELHGGMKFSLYKNFVRRISNADADAVQKRRQIFNKNPKLFFSFRFVSFFHSSFPCRRSLHSLAFFSCSYSPSSSSASAAQLLSARPSPLPSSSSTAAAQVFFFLKSIFNHKLVSFFIYELRISSNPTLDLDNSLIYPLNRTKRNAKNSINSPISILSSFAQSLKKEKWFCNFGLINAETNPPTIYQNSSILTKI